MYRVLLVNMPFAAVEFPSLALGLLKGSLKRKGIPCDAAYLNIPFAEMIGMEDYNYIVMGPGFFAGERVFAHTLYGNMLPDDNQYYNYKGNVANPTTRQRIQRIESNIPRFLDYCMQNIPWDQYDIIGFSSLFEQNLASLSLAYLVKQRWPNKIIVFGGPNWEGQMGITLHIWFPFVDFVCPGEADFSFPELIKRLYWGHPIKDLGGIVFREQGQSISTGRPQRIENLDELAYPDFEDYFQARERCSFGAMLPPYLLFETARGCWWGQRGQCMFCGLNGENTVFRSKSAQRILDEIDYLVEHYDIRCLRAADNVLDLRYFKEGDLLPELARRKSDLRFIFEIRANMKKHQVKMLSEAGITAVQAGIENLCNHILQLMNKGTDTLTNVQLLKWCKQYHVKADWNIIFGFPGEKPTDYGRLLELIKVLSHLHPPTGFSPIRMDRFSPNFNRADELGFCNLRAMSGYQYIYPFDAQTLYDMAYYFDFEYREKIDDGGYYSALLENVMHWKCSQDQLYAYKEEDKVIIYDTRPVATAVKMVLTGVPKIIYEYCDTARSLEQIETQAKKLSKEKIDAAQVQEILDNLTARHLMIRENDRYLSLAVLTYALDSDAKE